jgi:LmbE family N-acetylglucosaminyl deacetylase
MTLINDPKKILILAPHTDDGELGCGGTIAHFISMGSQVFYVAFASKPVITHPPEFPEDVLEKEVKKATHVLGLQQENLMLYDFRIRYFSSQRQEILEEMVKLNKQINPDLVFMPSTNDTHQDHQIVSSEGLRAFKKTSILGYELPWNNFTFSNHCFVSLDEKCIKRKIDALNCYDSQKDRDYLHEDFIRGLAITRGTQIGRQYAEAFEVIRLIL